MCLTLSLAILTTAARSDPKSTTSVFITFLPRSAPNICRRHLLEKTAACTRAAKNISILLKSAGGASAASLTPERPSDGRPRHERVGTTFACCLSLSLFLWRKADETRRARERTANPCRAWGNVSLLLTCGVCAIYHTLCNAETDTHLIPSICP